MKNHKFLNKWFLNHDEGYVDVRQKVFFGLCDGIAKISHFEEHIMESERYGCDISGPYKTEEVEGKHKFTITPETIEHRNEMKDEEETMKRFEEQKTYVFEEVDDTGLKCIEGVMTFEDEHDIFREEKNVRMKKQIEHLEHEVTRRKEEEVYLSSIRKERWDPSMVTQETIDEKLRELEIEEKIEQQQQQKSEKVQEEEEDEGEDVSEKEEEEEEEQEKEVEEGED